MIQTDDLLTQFVLAIELALQRLQDEVDYSPCGWRLSPTVNKLEDVLKLYREYREEQRIHYQHEKPSVRDCTPYEAELLEKYGKIE